MKKEGQHFYAFVCYSWWRVSLFFSKTGDYIKEIKARSTIYWGGRPTANGFIAKGRTTESDFQYDTIWLYDQNLVRTKEIYRAPFFWQYKKSSDR